MQKKIKLTELINPKNFNKYKDDLLHYFDKGGTWQELLGYDDHLLNGQYKKAYDFYQNADYKNAAASFIYLTTLNPYVYDYWMGLGLTKQLERFYEEAIVSFTVAETLQEDNPLPTFHLAQCFYALQQRELTLNHLKRVIEVAGEKSEFQEIKKKAEIVMNNLPK